jgi:hypothetical protein
MPIKGFKHSEETKKLLSIKHKGKKLSEEHKQKISIAKKGRRLGWRKLKLHPRQGPAERWSPRIKYYLRTDRRVISPFVK